MVGALGKTLAFAIAGQLLPACFFVPLATEKYYDLCGTLGFLSTTAISLYLSPSLLSIENLKPRGGSVAGRGLRSIVDGVTSFLDSAHNDVARARHQSLFLGRHPRQWIASACVAVWSARLGSYLFARIHKSGSDPRFDSIKQDPAKFAFAWIMQGVWVALTALPVFMINSRPAHVQPAMGTLDVVALSVWAAGIVFEIVADRTKSAWRTEREQGKHQEKFLRRGVWSWCRHPNYFGEITLWTGLALLAIFSLQSESNSLVHSYVGLSAYLPLLSPLFEYALIRYLSGVPMLERDMDKKNGDDPAYKAYKRQVPCFVPFVGSKE